MRIEWNGVLVRTCDLEGQTIAGFCARERSQKESAKMFWRLSLGDILERFRIWRPRSLVDAEMCRTLTYILDFPPTLGMVQHC